MHAVACIYQQGSFMLVHACCMNENSVALLHVTITVLLNSMKGKTQLQQATTENSNAERDGFTHHHHHHHHGCQQQSFYTVSNPHQHCLMLHNKSKTKYCFDHLKSMK